MPSVPSCGRNRAKPGLTDRYSRFRTFPLAVAREVGAGDPARRHHGLSVDGVLPDNPGRGKAILVIGRYPRGLFDFNVGVLRWGWRISYYASSGGLGTDRYPPFTLEDDPAYPARLDVTYPTRMSRPLVLVKWLLALPHVCIVALLVGGSVGWIGSDVAFVTQTGLLGVLVLAAAVVLATTGSYLAASWPPTLRGRPRTQQGRRGFEPSGTDVLAHPHPSGL